MVAQGPAPPADHRTSWRNRAGPGTVKVFVQLYIDQTDVLTREIEELHGRLTDATRENAEMRRFCSVRLAPSSHSPPICMRSQ